MRRKISYRSYSNKLSDKQEMEKLTGERVGARVGLIVGSKIVGLRVGCIVEKRRHKTTN